MPVKPKIVVIGGGTGTYTVLTGLKKYPVDLSVVVSMMDDGGSNRVIRDEFGLLPTSDIRQCVVALSEEKPNDLVRKLFSYRFNSGTGITGMTFGNLFMAALTDIYGSQKLAIKNTCEFLDVAGNIIPVTYDKVHLVARYENGKQVLGQHDIDEPNEETGQHRIVDLEVFPETRANTVAIKAIKEADLVVLGPGDFYTSILCNVVVPGIAQALRKSKAKVIFVMNLMTKFGQSNKFKASDFLNEMEKYLGGKVLDYVLVNISSNFPRGVLTRYKKEQAKPVIDDLPERNGSPKVIRGEFISQSVYQKPESDKLKRSLIRHDPDKLAKAIFSLL